MLNFKWNLWSKYSDGTRIVVVDNYNTANGKGFVSSIKICWTISVPHSKSTIHFSFMNNTPNLVGIFDLMAGFGDFSNQVKLEPDFINQVKLDPNFMNQVKLEPDFINQVKLEPELQHQPPQQQQQDHHLQQHNHQQVSSEMYTKQDASLTIFSMSRIESDSFINLRRSLFQFWSWKRNQKF